MKSVQASLAGLDAKMAAFKQGNLNSLPELAQTNLQELDRTEQDIDQMNDRLSTLKQQEGYLQTQLASIPTDSATSDKAQLQELRVKLVQLKNRYSDEYPDVKKTKSDIAMLEKQLRASGRDNLAKPDNPAYVTLSSQLTSTRSEIESVKRQIAMLRAKKDAYRGRIEASPKVEEGYRMILAERNNTQAKYDDLMKKYMEARVAHGMEKEQMGERFTLIDPAKMPEKPVSPNIPAILLIGLILGIGAGAGVASFQEYNDQSVRSFDELARVTGFPVLSSIPEIINHEDIAARRKTLVKVSAGVVTAVIAGLLIFNFFVMDLDVFWARLMRRMGI